MIFYDISHSATLVSPISGLLPRGNLTHSIAWPEYFKFWTRPGPGLCYREGELRRHEVILFEETYTVVISVGG
jgi:hypothetical protein